jgi:hypothetical protein
LIEFQVCHSIQLSSIVSVVTFLIIFSYFTPLIGAQSNDISTGPKPYGKPLEEWAKEYWQWNIGVPPGDIPKDVNTNLDKCIVGSDRQNTMTLLLGVYGLTYSTKCNISSAKPILIPLLAGECNPTVPGPRSKNAKIEDLWACAKDADEGLNAWEVRLDDRVLFKKAGNEEVNGHLIDNILVRNSSVFNITIPQVNRYEADAGVYPAVVDGYYLILKPLPPGEHILTYKFKLDQKIPGTYLSYVNGDATYLLTVN